MKADQAGNPAGGRLLTRGHPLAVAAVRRAIDRERAPHALLLVGPRGCGKTTLALDLAAGLLCLAHDPGARPCRVCPACRKVEHGNHPDVHRIVPDGAGEQIRIGQVQTLIGELALLPMEGRTRVAIIEQAHRLNPDAQNALLKTLEEPVGAACLVLCADDGATILPTVISRSSRFRLGPVPVPEVAALLAQRGLADAHRASSLATASGGMPGVAVSMAAAPDAILIQARLARQLTDLLAADRRARLEAVGSMMSDAADLDATLSGTVTAITDTADGSAVEEVARPTPRRRASTTAASPSRTARRPAPAERRRAARRVLLSWREVGRDLAVIVRGARPRLRQTDLLDELEAAAPRVDPTQLVAFLDRLDGLTAAIDAYANPELVLDDLVLRWPRTSTAASAAPRHPLPQP